MVADVWPEKKSWSNGAGGSASYAGHPRRPEDGRRAMTELGADRRRRRSSAKDVGVRRELEASPTETEGKTELLEPPRSSEDDRRGTRTPGAKSAHRRLAGEEGSSAATTSHNRPQNPILMGGGARGEEN